MKTMQRLRISITLRISRLMGIKICSAMKALSDIMRLIFRGKMIAFYDDDILIDID